MDETVAAVMVEVVQGEGGVVVGEKSFLQAAQQLCQTYGALLIVDEVQTGIGRTGTLFAYEQFDISPDVITIAKGLGSGFPVGAMLGKNMSSQRLAQVCTAPRLAEMLWRWQQRKQRLKSSLSLRFYKKYRKKEYISRKN